MVAHCRDGARRTALCWRPPEGARGPWASRPASTLRSQTGSTMPCHGPRAAAAPCPPLVLWGWQLIFHFVDQGIEGRARDWDQLPFLGNRDRGCHGLHVEAAAFELVAECTFVLLEHLDFILDREVAFQELADHLEIHRRLKWFCGLGHCPSPFLRLLCRDPHH